MVQRQYCENLAIHLREKRMSRDTTQVVLLQNMKEKDEVFK